MSRLKQAGFVNRQAKTTEREQGRYSLLRKKKIVQLILSNPKAVTSPLRRLRLSLACTGADVAARTQSPCCVFQRFVEEGLGPGALFLLRAGCLLLLLHI
jgi:hypothetical protein